MFLNILQCVLEMVTLSSYTATERLTPLFDRTVNNALVQEVPFIQSTLSQLFNGLNGSYRPPVGEGAKSYNSSD